MGERHRTTITDAEVLAVCGEDDATGQPVVVLTLRPNAGSGWRFVNYSLHPGNARSLLDRLCPASASCFSDFRVKARNAGYSRSLASGFQSRARLVPPSANLTSATPFPVRRSAVARPKDTSGPNVPPGNFFGRLLPRPSPFDYPAARNTS